MAERLKSAGRETVFDKHLIKKQQRMLEKCKNYIIKAEEKIDKCLQCKKAPYFII